MTPKIKKEIEFLKSLTTYYGDNQIAVIKQYSLSHFVYTKETPTEPSGPSQANFKVDVCVYREYKLAAIQAKIVGNKVYAIRSAHTELVAEDWICKEFTNAKGYKRRYLTGYKTTIEMNF